MSSFRWVPPGTRSILDVGCNIGALLSAFQDRIPGVRLAGSDVNRTAITTAKARLPQAELHCCGAERLPYPDETFDCVTCIEVLEHIPPRLWAASLREMRRVLRSGGRLILSTPHAGAFAWMDSNNVRFRLPWVYRKLIGAGRRDAGYAERDEKVEWHYHFTRSELLALAGSGWVADRVCYGGLLFAPLADWMSWPFYRLGKPNHPIRRALEQVATIEQGMNFGPLSYGILLVLRRA